MSRGVFHPTELLETEKHGRNWLSGPEFLYDNNKMWNTQIIETFDEANPEIREAEPFVAINVVKKKHFDAYSIWKLVKDDQTHRLSAENLLQSQSKRIERGD